MQGGKERVAAMGTSSNGMAAGGGGGLGSEGIATRIGDKLTDMADRITQSGTSE